ncbi:MAG: CBS domain-containing protein [Pyrobaculum sp.]
MNEIKDFFSTSQIFLDFFRKCVTIIYLPKGAEKELSGYVYVHRGLVEVGGVYYESGDSAHVYGRARAEEESIVIINECETGYKSAGFRDCVLADLTMRDPVTVEGDVSMREAVRRMAEAGVSSVIVTRGGEPVGIFTDTDIRKAVAAGVDFNTPVESVSTKGLLSANLSTPCLEALVYMSLNNIKHLAVVDSAGRLRGVVTMRDLAYRLSPLPLHVVRDMKKIREVSELKKRLEEVRSWGRRAGEGALNPEFPHPLYLTKIMTYINDEVMKIAAAEVQKRLGPPPHPFVIMASGSQGVYEQFIVTDIDNYLVYSKADNYFKQFGELFIKYLIDLGYPPCKDGNTADRLQLSLDDVSTFLENSGDKDVVAMQLLFDGRPIYGVFELGDLVKDVVCAKASSQKLRVVSNALKYKPPLGPMDRLQKEFSPKHALASLTMPVKALSMVYCIKAPTVPQRIRELGARAVYSKDLENKLVEAYDVLLRLAIWAKARGVEKISADELPNRDVVKAALRSVKTLHDKLEREPPP